MKTVKWQLPNILKLVTPEQLQKIKGGKGAPKEISIEAAIIIEDDLGV